MKAVVLTKPGGPEVLQVQDRPDPPVGPGEVRVAVKAAGINFADLMARVGVYPDAPPPPCVLGYEFAGEVESVGEGVEKVKVGDRVVGGTRFNGQAELVTVTQDTVWPLPDALSFEEGAAFPVNYATAYAALVVMTGVSEGERVLIHAAAGGVGISATQIAKARGRRSSANRLGLQARRDPRPGRRPPDRLPGARLRRRGSADHEGDGVDMILDAQGPSSFRKDYRLLRQGGRLVMFGFAGADRQAGHPGAGQGDHRDAAGDDAVVEERGRRGRARASPPGSTGDS